MIKQFILGLFMVSLTTLSATGAHAIPASAPPQTINYQGTLATSGKTPVTATVSMTFAIYNAASGGSALWTENQSVAVSKGVYSVILGSTTPIALLFNAPYFLGVTVDSDAEMTPRLALTSSPYAFNVVNGAVTNLGISASAAIADSKLATIATAGKVSGAALTSLASVPSAAGALPIANGGTGTTTASGALANLLPTQTGNGSKVLTTDGTSASWNAVSGGVTSVSASAPLSVATGTTTPVISLGTVGLANGGTGAATAAAALGNLLPSQTSNSGKVLTTDGTTASWGTASGGGVTSVSATAPLTVSNGTTTPSITLGTVGIANGGTGGTTGSITGTGALTFTAGSTNTNINLVPNGTGTVDMGTKRITRVASPTTGTDAATKTYADSVGVASKFGTNTSLAADGTGGECTIGSVWLVAGSVGSGTPCAGQTLTISSNTALFALLGITYGGNGTTTFMLPDLRGAAPNGLTYVICTSGYFPSRN